MKLKIVCDAACRVADAHKPGRTGKGKAAGGVLILGDGKVLGEYSFFLGEMTISEAEYSSLIRGLEIASGLTKGELEVWLDSEFIMRQMKGEYKVRSAEMKRLFLRVKELEKRFGKVEYFHHKRTAKLAAEADRLANSVLDGKGNKT